VITTERLILRRPRREDAVDLAVAYADPEVVRFMGDGSTATLTEVEEGIDELADYAGLKAHVAAITERAMRGEIEFEPFPRACPDE